MKNNSDTQKNLKTYTKNTLIRNIAKATGKSLPTVRAVYNALENSLVECLSSASPETDVSVRLFEGITIDSTFLPEKLKTNNLTGEVITTTSKVKPKANITRYYCDKLTNYNS